MIKELEEFFETLFGDISFGQIQDEPDNIVNMRIYTTNKKLFFKNNKTKELNIDLFIRNESFSKLNIMNEDITDKITDVYDKTIGNLHLVFIKQVNGTDPLRDEKERYCIISNFNMILEGV